MGGISVKSQEGNTQGDSLAMPLHALSTIPLIEEFSFQSTVLHVWQANDSAAAGFVSDIKQWWSTLVFHGPSYIYFVNDSKTWLVTKEEAESATHELFKNSSINFATEGCLCLEVPLGTGSFINEFVPTKVEHRRSMSVLSQLSDTSTSSPHAGYTAITNGIFNLWPFLCYTTKIFVEPLESLI